VLAKFEKRGLIARKASGTDARQSHLSLTPRGRQAFAPLEVKTQKQVDTILGKLSGADQQRLVEAMHTIEKLLGQPAEQGNSYLLRSHRPGDMGWVVHRHGAFYAAEYGWDQRFEALTAEIVAKFILNFDPQRERCWIAEQDGAIIGSVFLVKKSDRIAKLRLLLVEASARGLGIGKRLVNDSIQFARETGYRQITLWTQSNLYAARHIYKTAGFRLTKKERVKQFGHEMTSETWDLKLQRAFQ
jgi:GNAT superfamily N-acetyltransferase